MIERTATIEELEERVKQLEGGLNPPWLIDALKKHGERIDELRFKVDRLTGGKSVAEMLMEDDQTK
jgi:hypothetical protein